MGWLKWCTFIEKTDKIVVMKDNTMEEKRMQLDAQKKKKFLEQIDLFVLDMDGTFYLGDRILEGSLNF